MSLSTQADQVGELIDRIEVAYARKAHQAERI